MIFNETGERSIYFTKVPITDYKFYYFFGLDTDSLIKNNKYINYEDYIYPKMVLSLNSNSFDESGICFGCQDENILLLMKIDFNLLDDEQIKKLMNKNLIEKINDNYYINFGQFNEGFYLLRNIRNFLSNFYIDNKNFNFIKLIPENYDFTPIENPQADLNENIYCMCCGEKIDITYELNKDFKDIVGENPDRCASCFSKIMISYFIKKIEGISGSKEYIKKISSKPDLINFYFTLLETTGIISRDSSINFINGFEHVNKDLYNQIPSKYLIEDDYNNKFLKSTSKVCENIDKLTLYSYSYDVLSVGFQNKLINSKLSLEDGWKIRDKLISKAIDGTIPYGSSKFLNECIDKIILIDFKHRKPKSKTKLKYQKDRKPKSKTKLKNQKNRNHKSKKTKVKNKNKKKPKKIKPVERKIGKGLFVKSDELKRLAVNSIGTLRESYKRLLNQNDLSLEDGDKIVCIIRNEFDQKKLTEEDVEERLYQLIEQFTTKKIK